MTDFKQNFINDYGQLAQDIANQTGLDPTLVLGQAANESDWGRRVSGNNIFGISPGGRVAAFPSIPVAGQAYVDLINRRYSGAALKSDISSQASALASMGYNPDRSYGQRLTAAAASVRAAGYNPTSGSDADVESGKALFQQMTGTAPPPMPSEMTQKVSVDVSSNPDVDAGEEIFKSVTGIDPQVPINKTGTPEQPANAAQSAAIGALHGVATTDFPLMRSGVNLLASNPVSRYVDQTIPVLGQLDKNYSPDPKDEAANEVAYEQKYGNRLSAQLGNFAGQTVATLPVTLPLGAAGGALAKVAGPATSAAIKIGTGALQGGVAAGMTGGNMLYGSLGGGALGALGAGANALSATSPAALQSKVADQIVTSLSKGVGLHFGDFGGYLVGEAAAPIIRNVLTRYGPATAGLVKRAIDAANASGVGTTAAGIYSGGIKNRLTGQ